MNFLLNKSFKVDSNIKYITMFCLHGTFTHTHKKKTCTHTTKQKTINKQTKNTKKTKTNIFKVDSLVIFFFIEYKKN